MLATLNKVQVMLLFRNEGGFVTGQDKNTLCALTAVQ